MTFINLLQGIEVVTFQICHLNQFGVPYYA